MEPGILARRAEIARAIEGQTVCGLLELAAREFAGRPALSESLSEPGPGPLLWRPAPVRCRAPHAGRRRGPLPGPGARARRRATEDLAAHPDVLAAVGQAVAAANARLARFQQVKRWRLLPREWTSATGELTRR